MKHVSVNLLAESGISHNPNIKKKVILDKGYIPQLMTFGQAIFLPGQSVDAHKHDTMFEVFYIQSGKAIFIVNGKRIEINAGECVSLEPGEIHSQENPFNEPVTWLYFGIAID